MDIPIPCRRLLKGDDKNDRFDFFMTMTMNQCLIMWSYFCNFLVDMIDIVEAMFLGILHIPRNISDQCHLRSFLCACVHLRSLPLLNKNRAVSTSRQT